MNIIIKTIPHTNQRYETCGDWWFDDKEDLQIRVSDTGNIWYDVLIAVHELWEALLCRRRGIREEKVSAFDFKFEEERLDGKHTNNEEPGDDPRAPYRKEHFSATTVERLLATELGIDWIEYDSSVIDL